MSLKTLLTRLNRRDLPLLPKVPKFFKFTIIAIILSSSMFLASQILAQAETESIFTQEVNAYKQETNFNTLVGKHSIASTIVGAINGIVDIENAPPEMLEGQPAADGSRNYHWIPGGAVGSMNGAIASLYNQPASGIEYIASLKDNLLGKPAYAQGVGFMGLQPLLPLWRGFRNIIYILSSLIFIIIGIMIILRVKISPQAVITVQNALPNLITTLILVTFSYAIAGLVIDAMYFVQSAFLAVIFNSVGKGLSDNLLSGNIITTSFSDISNYNLGTVLFLMTKNISLIVVMLLGALIGAGLGALVGTPLPVIGLGIGVPLGAGLGAAIVVLIVLITILVILFKFLFALIKAYITVLIKIILAPLEIGMGAFPTSKTGFSSWMMDLIANISIFPISLIFLVLVNIIAESFAGADLWAPGIVGGVTALMPFIIAMGGLLLLPKLPELIPQVIFSIKPSPFGQAIGKSYSEISGIATTPGKYGVQYLSNTQKEEYSNMSPAARATRASVAENSFFDLLGVLGKVKR